VKESFSAWSKLVVEPMMLLDDDGAIVAANRPMEVLVGRSSGELVGAKAADLCVEGERVRAADYLASARRVTAPMPGRLTLATETGALEARCSASAMLTGSGRFIVVRFTLADEHDRFRLLNEKIDALTEEVKRRRAIEHELAGMYERAKREAERAEEASRIKDEFLATVSHELRTPLSAILGWASILRTDRRADPTIVDKAVEVIERNANSQLRIIEDILDVSRIVRGELRIETDAIELAPIGRDVVESLRPAADAKEIQLTLSSEGACRVVGDPDRLRQIVWNLLSNAVKFTGAGGRVVLGIEQVGPKVTISVSDTGRGIDPKFLPHVFERFRQADSSMTRTFGGLGLGLAIVRHLTEAHGGRVRAESDGLGKGANFVVELPVKTFAEHATTSSELLADTPVRTSHGVSGKSLSGLRVLVVEDEPDARELIQIVLADEGATVSIAASAETALKSIEPLGVDVLVSDIGLPTRDGYWLLEQVRRRFPRLPAIALTAFARREDARRAHAAGFDHHLGKPVDPKELVSVVASCRTRARAVTM